MKIKTKKDWQNEIEARVAAAEAVGEEKLANARRLHADELAKVEALAQAAASDAEIAAANALAIGNVATVGMQLLDVAEGEIQRVQGHLDTIGNVASNTRNRVGALAATLSALRYAEQTPQIARVLDAVDGFVDLIRNDADKLVDEAALAATAPDYELPGLGGIFPTLADDIEDERTVEIDLSDFGSTKTGIGETDAERSFFNE